MVASAKPGAVTTQRPRDGANLQDGSRRLRGVGTRCPSEPTSKDQLKLIMVDDSEQPKPTRARLGHLVAVGAVVFPEEGLATYRDGIRVLCAELGIPPESS